MLEEVRILKEQADEAKYQFKIGLINYDKAKANIEPYVNKYNERSKIIAKKYNQRPKLITVSTYLR